MGRGVLTGFSKKKPRPLPKCPHGFIVCGYCIAGSIPNMKGKK